jgi:site-specific recombinase XerC
MAEDDWQRLLDTVAEAEGPEAQRDYMLFALMLRTGIRLGSALGLDVEDVDLEHGELHLRCMKGDRPDRVFLSRTIRDELRAYLQDRAGGALFVTKDGRRLSARHAQRRMEKWINLAGVTRRATPHSLRHSFATDLYRRTGDILLVKEALNHRSLVSTMCYARTSAQRLREALEA